jgi:hypothetical protein
VWGWGRGEEEMALRPGNKYALIAIAASIFGLIFVFAKSLGISSPWDFVPAGAAGVCFYLAIRGFKKIKNDQIGKPVPIVPLAARKRLFWAVALGLIISSIACLPLAPYMVDYWNPSFYFYVVPADFIGVSIILFCIWKKLVGSANSPK